jgi:DNA-directed RNA polymerase subunit RPC12/RpoP
MWVFRIKRSAYALSLLLCVMGIIALLAILWITWPQVSAARDPFSTFLTLIWTRNLDFIPGFKLAYLVALGDVMLISGVIVSVFSVRRFYLMGEVVWYQCPWCHKDWRSSGIKALVHCPNCRQLVHPILIEKQVK